MAPNKCKICHILVKKKTPSVVPVLMSLNDLPEDGLEDQNIYKKSHDANKICNKKSIAKNGVILFSI